MTTKKRTYFLNPLATIPDNWQLAAAVGILIFSICVSFFTAVAHDGILHGTYLKNQSMSFLLVSNITVVLLPALLIFCLAKLFNNRTRFIDIFSTVLFSRLPLVISYAIFFSVVDKKLLENMSRGNFSPDTISASDMATLTFLGLISLPFLVYSFIILVNGYKTSMYAKKPLHYLGLAAAIIIAELIYRFLLFPQFIKF